MRHRKPWQLNALVAAGAATALLLSACGGGGGSTPQGSSGSSSGGSAFNSALTGPVNPSDTKGGTLKFANSGDWDTLDPGAACESPPPRVAGPPAPGGTLTGAPGEPPPASTAAHC